MPPRSPVPLPVRDLANTIPDMGKVALKRGINVGDAKHLPALWNGLPAPSSIITSPPYLDMHDYGNDSLIGARGQDIREYLDHMSALFGACHQVSNSGATFWLVAGSIRRNGRVLALPNMLAECAERQGWILRETITWDKQKGLISNVTQARTHSVAGRIGIPIVDLRGPSVSALTRSMTSAIS